MCYIVGGLADHLWMSASWCADHFWMTAKEFINQTERHPMYTHARVRANTHDMECKLLHTHTHTHTHTNT